MQEGSSRVYNGRHWHYVYRRRRRHHHNNSREILFGQLISLVGAVAAGFILELGKHEIAMIAGAFVILPGIFDLGGSIAGALAAKISHHLEVRPSSKFILLVAQPLLFALSVAAVSSAFLGLFGAALGALLFNASFLLIFKLSILSCLLVAGIGFPLIVLATFVVFKMGADPDNVIGPIETSIFDSLTVLALLVSIGMLT